MPNGVENLGATTVLLPPQSSKILPPKSDGDSFEQVLQRSAQKPKAQTNDSDQTTKSAKPTDAKPSQTQDQSDEDSDKTSDASPQDVKQADDQSSQVAPKPQPQTDAPHKTQKVEGKVQADQTDQPSDVDPAAKLVNQAVVVAAQPQAVQQSTSENSDKTKSDSPTTNAKQVLQLPQNQAEKLPSKPSEPNAKNSGQVVKQVVSENQQSQQDAQENNPEAQSEDDQTEQVAQSVAAVKTVTGPLTKQAKEPAVDSLSSDQNLKAEEVASSDKTKPAKPVDPAIDSAIQNFAAVAEDATPDTSAPQQRSAPATQQVDLIDPGNTAKPQANAQAVSANQVAHAPQAAAPDADLTATNHEKIVQSVRTQLLPNGGTMQIRLDPPEMGQLQVTVRMNDGAMTATFETSNDQATKMLSHSLGQLKQALETQGVSVEKLHVQQSPRDQQSNSSSEEKKQQAQQDGQSSQRDQQRRDMLRRMWAKLGVGDPLDMVA